MPKRKNLLPPPLRKSDPLPPPGGPHDALGDPSSLPQKNSSPALLPSRPPDALSESLKPLRSPSFSYAEKATILTTTLPVSGADLAYRLCRDFGATQEEMAVFFEVSVRALKYWIAEIPEFREAVVRGRDECASGKVEAKLFTKTQGYDYQETTRERPVFKNKSSGELTFGELVVTKEVTKHLPPDTLSMIYWLKNRQRDRWRDAQEHDVNLKGKMTFEINSLIPEPDKPPPGRAEA